MLTAEPNEKFIPNFGAARLTRANLEGANLSKAKASFVDFREANLKNAVAIGTLLQGADLRNANLQYADFSYAELKTAVLSGCNLCSANLYLANGISQEQLNSSFGYAGTKIPQSLRFPDHWPTVQLDELDALINWRKWQADPEGYVPPDPPEGG